MKSWLNQSFIAAWLFCIVLATSCKKDTPAAAEPTQLSITTSATYRDMQQGNEIRYSGSGMEKYSFVYANKYPNKIDFSNATLLA